MIGSLSIIHQRTFLFKRYDKIEPTGNNTKKMYMFCSEAMIWIYNGYINTQLNHSIKS